MNKIIYWLFHMPCVFHLITGLYCPGCGGTRALLYLIHGQVLQSFIYHPLVLYGTVIVAVELVSAATAKWSGKPKYYLGHEALFIYVGTGIIAINWIVKNVLLVGFGIDLLSVLLG